MMTVVTSTVGEEAVSLVCAFLRPVSPNSTAIAARKLTLNRVANLLFVTIQTLLICTKLLLTQYLQLCYHNNVVMTT